ncbi:MAG: class I SAM-dependent methyltransferase [Zoogloeaceae bacterium]|nr:class I SAM-dependent methyltransferase [Zoogloeaceae bacterium]
MNIAIARRSTLSRIAAERAAWQNREQTVWKQIAAIEARIEQLRLETLKAQIGAQWRIIDLQYDFLPRNEQLECALCGFRGERSAFREYRSHCIFGGGKLIRHQCPECDVIFGPAKMLDLTPDQLTQEYVAHYSLFQEGDSTEPELRAFHALNPRRDGLYMNYGAGAWSRSVDELRRDGWNVVAYEPHESATGGGEGVVQSKEELAAMGGFDGIYSNNVLEHLRHPVEELKAMAGYLKPGGKMSHATPCFGYLYEYTRFHLFFFLGRSRSFLAQSANLKIDSYTEDGEFMNIVLAKD